MYALDTNSLVYFFKDVGGIGERLLATPPREVGLPTIVLYELEVGAAKSQSPERRRRHLDEVVSWMTLLPFGAEEAKIAARIRADLEQEGMPIGPYDILIAATALRHGATLVTRNVGEFSRVAGLALENWYDSAAGTSA